MNSENSSTFEYHVLLLKRGQKIIALSNLNIYNTWKNIKGLYNNNKFKLSVPL